MPSVLPKWFNEINPTESENEERVFLLRLAALYASPEGTLPFLSRCIGRNPNYLTTLCTPRRGQARGLVDHMDAIEIEKLVGREVMPRERLRPDIFLIDRRDGLPPGPV